MNERKVLLALEAMHKATDLLLARVIAADPAFMPTKWQGWPAIVFCAEALRSAGAEPGTRPLQAVLDELMSLDLPTTHTTEARSFSDLPGVPADLASAHYRIEFGGADCPDEHLRGRYWWTLCEPGHDVVPSLGEWDTVGEAIDAARLDMQEHAEERAHAHAHAGDGEPDPCDDLPRHQGTRQRFDQGR